MDVGSADTPAKRNAGGVSGDRPLPAALGPVHRALSCSFPSSWGLMDGPVHRDIGEVESDDLVVARDGLGGDGLEDSRRDPVVAPLTSCRVRDHPPRQMLGVFPAAPCDQAHEHHPKAVPIGLPPPVTTQRMVVETGRDERLDASPEGIYNFGVERVNYRGTSTWSLVVG